jgi:Zn finger protein HypA/HybF involved in hydrogenase expression
MPKTTPENWTPVIECKKCKSNFHKSINELPVCPNCGNNKFNELEPFKQYMLLGKCPHCGKDLYAYREKTDLNISYIPNFKKSVLSCIYCNKIIGITEKTDVPYMWI